MSEPCRFDDLPKEDPLNPYPVKDGEDPYAAGAKKVRSVYTSMKKPREKKIQAHKDEYEREIRNTVLKPKLDDFKNDYFLENQLNLLYLTPDNLGLRDPLHFFSEEELQVYHEEKERYYQLLQAHEDTLKNNDRNITYQEMVVEILKSDLSFIEEHLGDVDSEYVARHDLLNKVDTLRNTIDERNADIKRLKEETEVWKKRYGNVSARLIELNEKLRKSNSELHRWRLASPSKSVVPTVMVTPAQRKAGEEIRRRAMKAYCKVEKKPKTESW